MSGYSGYSMSNNAVDAYESGEKPRSKWTKKVLLSAIFSIEQMAVERRSLQMAFNASNVWMRRRTSQFRTTKYKKKTTLRWSFFTWTAYWWKWEHPLPLQPFSCCSTCVRFLL